MEQGFTFKNVNSNSFGLTVKTLSFNSLPSQRISTESVMGRDGGYFFTEGLNTRTYKFLCTISSNLNYALRRSVMREISTWLTGTGKLIINASPGIQWTARISNQVDLSKDTVIDTFEVEFETDTIGESVNDGFDLTSAETEYSPDDMDFPSDTEYQTTFTTVTGYPTISIWNIGNYIAKPIIKILGNTTRLSFTDDRGNTMVLVNISGETWIDCNEKVVYSVSGGVKTNIRNKLSGNWIELNTGENTINLDVMTGYNVNLYWFKNNAYL